MAGTTIYFDNGTEWVAAPAPEGKLYFDNGTQWVGVDLAAPPPSTATLPSPSTYPSTTLYPSGA